jgi:hypothetical protein
MTRWWLAAAVCLALVQGAATGQLSRSASEVRAFRAANPCPITGQIRGPCKGFEVDHAIPLCAGGPDHRSNMAWLSLEDHRFKTFVDVRECRKLAKLARTPAH